MPLGHTPLYTLSYRRCPSAEILAKTNRPRASFLGSSLANQFEFSRKAKVRVSLCDLAGTWATFRLGTANFSQAEPDGQVQIKPKNRNRLRLRPRVGDSDLRPAVVQLLDRRTVCPIQLGCYWEQTCCSNDPVPVSRIVYLRRVLALRSSSWPDPQRVTSNE